ncbi:hypothetical protein RB195_013978 [Necator americanus]|uniref:Reverse transcriptase domain-containing protein n=1 Tax=Necator americanus TaxID=51031 RepID=A0ABR1DYF3_NECAM
MDQQGEASEKEAGRVGDSGLYAEDEKWKISPAGCTAPFNGVAGVRQEATAEAFLPNFSIDDIVGRTVDQCPSDIVLAQSGCPLTDLEHVDNFVIFAKSSAKLRHVVNLVSKLASAWGFRQCPNKYKQM